MDKLVIDIETSNTFADVGGFSNVKDLKISLIGVYSYKQDQYLSFDEHNLSALEPLLKSAGLIIGFAINRFDLPVMQKHYPFNLMKLERIDILDEIELAAGFRVKLNTLAKANLGMEKTHESGLEAITMYQQGRLAELREYCLNDVKLTKELYDLVKKQGFITIPPKDGIGLPTKLELKIQEPILSATLF